MRNIIFVMFLLSFVALVGCGSESSDDSGITEPGEDSSPLDINFSATSDVTVEDPISSINLMAAVTPSDSYCIESIENSEIGSLTQRCSATPENYKLGILGIYFVSCKDTSGTEVVCEGEIFSGDVSVFARQILYEFGQVDIDIGKPSVNFNGSITPLTSSVAVGGLQIVTAYLEQRFPSTGSEADKIAASLRGKSYRICTTPTSVGTSDPTLMETRCGIDEAEMGDYLIDLDDDGTFGFMQVDDANTISEISTRPAAYEYNDQHFPDQEVCFAGMCEDEYTTSDSAFFGVPGYLAFIMPFDEVKTINFDASYKINASFDLTDTFEWNDGSDSQLVDPDICVEALLGGDTCESEGKTDSDPGSVGVYNPFYDTAFLPYAPSVSVSLTLLGTSSTAGPTGVYFRRSHLPTWVKLMGNETPPIASGDLDGDSKSDIVFYLPVTQEIWVYYGKGSWVRIANTSASYLSSTVCDYDGDGKDDYISSWSGVGLYWRNSDTGSWTKIDASEIDSLACADLDNDGSNDLIGASVTNGIWALYANASSWTRITINATSDIATCDMNGDGRVDLLGTGYGLGGISFRNSNTTNWANLTSTASDLIACGDLDNDGKGDIIAGYSESNSLAGIRVKYSNSDWSRLSNTAPFDLASGDMDLDGIDDCIGSW